MSWSYEKGRETEVFSFLEVKEKKKFVKMLQK